MTVLGTRVELYAKQVFCSANNCYFRRYLLYLDIDNFEYSPVLTGKYSVKPKFFSLFF